MTRGVMGHHGGAEFIRMIAKPIVSLGREMLQAAGDVPSLKVGRGGVWIVHGGVMGR